MSLHARAPSLAPAQPSLSRLGPTPVHRVRWALPAAPYPSLTPAPAALPPTVHASNSVALPALRPVATAAATTHSPHTAPATPAVALRVHSPVPHTAPALPAPARPPTSRR